MHALSLELAALVIIMLLKLTGENTNFIFKKQKTTEKFCSI